MTPAPPSIPPDAFAHIGAKYQGKVAKDLLSFTKEDKTWDFEKFNPLNDYQRHLYALFLRLSGVSFRAIAAKLWAISEDVEPGRRQIYVLDVLHSEIVGFPREDGSLLAIPGQQVIKE